MDFCICSSSTPASSKSSLGSPSLPASSAPACFLRIGLHGADSFFSWETALCLSCRLENRHRTLAGRCRRPMEHGFEVWASHRWLFLHSRGSVRVASARCEETAQKGAHWVLKLGVAHMRAPTKEHAVPCRLSCRSRRTRTARGDRHGKQNMRVRATGSCSLCSFVPPLAWRSCGKAPPENRRKGHERNGNRNGERALVRVT